MSSQVSAHSENPAVQPRRQRQSVCLIVQNQSFGGMEVHTLGLMQTLIEKGYQIELISNRYRGYDSVIEARGWAGDVQVIHTDFEGILYGEKGNEREWKKVFAALRSRVLIFPKGDSNYGQAGFLRACRAAFDRVVFVEHLEARPRPKNSRRWLGVIPGLGLWWHKRRILSKLGSRYADSIVAVSRSVGNRLVQELGYASEKVVVVHNGVPWQKFCRDEVRGAAIRAHHGIPADAFVFGMLGRLEAQKGVDIALHALRLLVERDDKTRAYLLVAGEGSQLAELTQLSSRLRIQDRLKFIGFVRDPADVLSGCDVILFSSRNEGLPLALLEGMAAGCIPIVTRISGMPEAVTSTEVGRVVRPEDAEELSAAMASILALDESALFQMRQSAVASVKQNFDITECHRRIIDICGLQNQIGLDGRKS